MIKDTGVLAVYKFNALLMLKETSKANNRRFIEYLDKKLLMRLHKIAGASSPRDCLKDYCKTVQSKEAERFYQLLMECFGNWGGMFKEVSRNYLKYAQDLSAKRKLPVKREFWNFPADLYDNNYSDNSVDYAIGQGFNNNGHLSPVNTSGLSHSKPPEDNQNRSYNNYPIQTSQGHGQINKNQPPLDKNETAITEIGQFNRKSDSRIKVYKRNLHKLHHSAKRDQNPGQ